MRDRIFFPLAAALAGAFVFMALNPLAERLPTGPVSGGGRNVMDLTVTGDELHRFVAGNYNGIDFVRAADGQPALLRLTRKATEDYQDPRSGPHLILAEDLEYAYEKRDIQIEIEARAAGDFAASQFEADYFAKAESETGWQTFDLTSEFRKYSFKFNAPSRGEALGYDFLGVRPVAPDKQRVMEIRSVRFVGLGEKH
jgi:hypothetical protein